MTEATIITAIIVGGIVGLAWVLLHFAFKAWQTERILQYDQQPLTTDINVNASPEPLSPEQVARRFGYSPN